MSHQPSESDRQFRADFEFGRIAPEDFNHRAHVRLAYVLLAEHDAGAAIGLMREALQSFLAHHGIPAAKYHETLTRAWILAVHHFMAGSPGAESAEAFIDSNPRLLDPQIMMTHYSAEVLFSPMRAPDSWSRISRKFRGTRKVPRMWLNPGWGRAFTRPDSRHSGYSPTEVCTSLVPWGIATSSFECT